MAEDKKIEDKKELTDEELKEVSGGTFSKRRKYCPHCKKRISPMDYICPYCGGKV